MRKIALAAALAALVASSSRPARACTDADLIPDWFVAAFAGSLVAGYVGGTGYFAYQDTRDHGRTDASYVGGEIAFNGIATAAFGAASIDMIRHKRGAAIPLVGLTALHGALLVHGIANTHPQFKNFNGTAATWTIGTLYVIDTLGFAAASHDPHGRRYGLAEAAIHVPLAAGLGYLAYQAREDGRGGRTLLFGGMAAISGALAIDGVRTAISPHRAPKLDLLGTDVMPSVVDDGRELGVGLGTAGTF